MNAIHNQIQTFNEKNIEAFLSNYTDDYKAYMLDSNQLITDGKEQLRSIMNDVFEKQGGAVKVLESMIQGDIVVQKEETRGHVAGKIISSITIYQLREGLISKMWFGGRTIRKE